MFKKLFFLFSAIGLLSMMPLQAAEKPTLTINGEQVQKVVTRITFDGDQAVLHFADQSDQKADMTQVFFTFASASAIQNVKTYLLRNVVDGRIQLDGLQPGTEVFVYDGNGKQVLRSKATTLDVSHLKGGVYMLKAGQQIVKFVKR